MAAEIAKMILDLAYALEEGHINFSQRDVEFIESIDKKNDDGYDFTDRQCRAIEVVWDKRLKGRYDYTKWSKAGDVLFDGKLYAEILGKLKRMYTEMQDGYIFTEWEEAFISELYDKYHPDNYVSRMDHSTFNPILTEKQMEVLERIYEKELG